MIAVDTNVLVHAHRKESPRHAPAKAWILRLAEGSRPWGLPVFCLTEFVRVVTHRRVFSPPSTLEQALDALSSLIESPSLQILLPGERFAAHLDATFRASGATGNLAFDAQIAALCLEHGVRDLLTEDRDFLRFPGLRTVGLDQPTP